MNLYKKKTDIKKYLFKKDEKYIKNIFTLKKILLEKNLYKKKRFI